MATNKTYICPYCMTEYKIPGDLARCILNCEEKKKLEEEAAKKAALAAEKDARYKEVIDAYDNFMELKGKYVADYGNFTFKRTSSDADLCDWILRTVGLF